MPSPLAGNPQITSPYGDHHGIDFAVPIGTPVLAPVSGTVVTARTMRNSAGDFVSYGRYVVIRDAQGREHYMAHMDGYLVQPGQTVTAGTVIGTSGNTGNSTGPHLHYEVRANGEQVDPTPLLGGTTLPNVRGYLEPEAAVPGSSLQPQNASSQYDSDPFGISAAVGDVLGLDPKGVRSTMDTIEQAHQDEEKLMGYVRGF